MSINNDGLESGSSVDFDTLKRIENERRQTKPEKPKVKPRATSKTRQPAVQKSPRTKATKKAQE